MGVLIADAVDAYNLRLVDFSPSTVSKFRATFPPYYQCANPMDLTGSAKTEDMLKAGKLALEDPNIDAVIMGVQPIAPGFADPDAVLTAVETRSSCPLRILRDEGGQSAIRGLFPCGEGAGYAGGILSAAADGMRTAEHVLNAIQETESEEALP